MESRKVALMDLFAGQHWRRKYKEQTCGPSGGRRGWDELRDERGNVSITIRKIDDQWEFAP